MFFLALVIKSIRINKSVKLYGTVSRKGRPWICKDPTGEIKREFLVVWEAVDILCPFGKIKITALISKYFAMSCDIIIPENAYGKFAWEILVHSDNTVSKL